MFSAVALVNVIYSCVSNSLKLKIIANSFISFVLYNRIPHFCCGSVTFCHRVFLYFVVGIQNSFTPITQILWSPIPWKFNLRNSNNLYLGKLYLTQRNLRCYLGIEVVEIRLLQQLFNVQKLIILRKNKIICSKTFCKFSFFTKYSNYK